MTTILDRPATLAAKTPTITGVRFEVGPDRPQRPAARTRLLTADGYEFLLTIHEMSLALAHSGARLDMGMSVEQVAGLVVQGARAVGGTNAVIALDYAERANNLQEMAGLITHAQWRRTQTRLWPGGSDQEDTAKILAMQLADVAERAGKVA